MRKAIRLHTRDALCRLGVAAIVGASLSCGGSGGDATGPSPGVPVTPTVPVPGRVVLTLTSPNGDDGAILMSVGGGQIDSLSLVAESTNRLRFTRPSLSTARVILMGTATKPIVAGDLVNLWVPDVAKVASYSAKVNQAAARVTYAQRDVESYVLRITKP